MFDRVIAWKIDSDRYNRDSKRPTQKNGSKEVMEIGALFKVFKKCRFIEAKIFGRFNVLAQNLIKNRHQGSGTCWDHFFPSTILRSFINKTRVPGALGYSTKCQKSLNLSMSRFELMNSLESIHSLKIDLLDVIARDTGNCPVCPGPTPSCQGSKCAIFGLWAHCGLNWPQKSSS